MSDVVDKKQQLLLEYLLSDRTVFVKTVRIMKPSYFEAPLDRVAEFIVSYFEKHHQLPKVDMIEADTGVVLRDREMDEGDISYFLDEFEQHCKNAAMTEAILASVDHINSGDHNAVQELVRKALLVRLDSAVGTNLFDDPYSRITGMAENVDERSCGIPEVDELIGKIRRGELGVFFASTAGGKSVTLANIARNLSLQQLNVLIISLELNEELYSKRMDSIMTGMAIAEHSQLAREISDALLTMQEGCGMITTKKMPYGTSPGDIRAVVMEYHLKYGFYPDALIVDYLGLMGGTRTKGMNKFDEDEIKAFGVRDLCAEYDIYGFTAGQINRDGYDVTNLGPQHVAGGISVINAADWAIGLVATEQDIDNNQVQAVQMKIRNGAKTTKPVVLYRDPKTLRIAGTPFNGMSGKSNHSSPLVKKKPGDSSEDQPKPKLNGKAKLAAALKR